jgi:NTP pyrophosphatase (non-canonical NTP hydrolase)
MVKDNTNPMPDPEVLIAGFDAYQARSIGTISYGPEMAIWYPALGLGEAGEVQNKVKKVYRDDGGVLTLSRRAAIKKEMGGVLWYLAALAHGMGESLGQIALDNLVELAGRQDRGTLHGDGDDR